MAIGEIISLCALAVSAFALIRSLSKDSKSNTTELTTVIVKLETIGNDITEIKKDLRSVKADIREHGERIAKTEQRVEALEKIVKIYHSSDNEEE